MKIEKLYPACKSYLWGGERLKQQYGKQTDCTPLAESWELSLHEDGQTTLSTGVTLAEALTLTPAALGKNAEGFPFFPLLIKLIDAKSDLSVQVHPSDAYAMKFEQSLGKTEMWYIVEAEEGAGIYLGFNRDVTEAELRAAIAEERLTELLDFQPVTAGETYFIPAGTVHAIGRGCLICEIQQNSNLTYRLYDYGRRDKNGDPRPLHIEQALAVAKLQKHHHTPRKTAFLGDNKYFSVKKVTVHEKQALYPVRSFQCLTCTKGHGSIDGRALAAGDSFFVPADHGPYDLTGEMELILTELRKYYIGIDLGGTFIKGGIVDDTGRILVQDQAPTESKKGEEAVISNIAALCRTLLARAELTAEDITGIGMGVPGMIDSHTGCVTYSNNLAWADLPLAAALEKEMGLPVRIANDANAAALGETKFGAGKHYQSTVMITLGTGVGSGIVMDGRPLEGNHAAGAELGHTVIVAGGEQCTCGRRGCFEAYASASALIRDTKRAMAAHPESQMWQIGTLDAVGGKTAFDFAACDETARAVVDHYIEMLGVGIVNIANALRPEAIILGGGVCNQGDTLLLPLRAILSRDLFGGERGPDVALLVGEQGNTAGLLGAAALWM